MALQQRAYFRAKQLGDGSFGAVLVVYDEDGNEFAAKRFDESEDGSCDPGALREVSFLRLLQRAQMDVPRLVRLHDISTLEGSLCMVMPRLTMSLEAAIKGKALTNPMKIQVAQDLLAGLGFMHASSFMHRDVKSANLMVDAEMRGVLIDFSLVKHESELLVPTDEAPRKRKVSKKEKRKIEGEDRQHTAGVGTPTYTAPEVVKGQPYDSKADAWSAGVVLLELFQGQELSVEKNSQAFRLIEETVAKMGDKPVPMLLKNLLAVDPAKRWSCTQAMRSAAFEKLPAVPDPRPVGWVPMKQPPVPPAEPKKGKSAAPTLHSEIAKWCTVLEFNSATERAARVFAVYAPHRPNIALHAVLLASRMHEQAMMDLRDCADWDDSLENFDVDAYLETEKQILQACDYCILLPPPAPLEDNKRRKYS
jgi:serine/threonine protein kinase